MPLSVSDRIHCCLKWMERIRSDFQQFFDCHRTLWAAASWILELFNKQWNCAQHRREETTLLFHFRPVTLTDDFWAAHHPFSSFFALYYDLNWRNYRRQSTVFIQNPSFQSMTFPSKPIWKLSMVKSICIHSSLYTTLQ